jgi:hypothetical protein
MERGTGSRHSTPKVDPKAPGIDTWTIERTTGLFQYPLPSWPDRERDQIFKLAESQGKYKKAYLTAAVSLSLATRYIRIQKATLMTA